MTGAAPTPALPLIPTSSQTVGPFYDIGLSHLATDCVPAAASGGDVLTIRGRVFDGDGAPVPDFLLEIWQDSASGPAGFARVMPADDASFRVRVIRPSPSITLLLFMRGLLKPLLTRMYVPGDPANDTDRVLASVPAERRETLIARPGPDGTLDWDIVLQGAGETVFFEW